MDLKRPRFAILTRRKLDAALAVNVTKLVGILRAVADEPAHGEGDLRDLLRQSAKMFEQLNERMDFQSKMIATFSRNFAILAALFGGLFMWNFLLWLGR